MNNYDVIIGLEIHTELNTKSKMFCSCPNDHLAETANNNTCPICLGHPGTLPAVNEQAVEYAVLLALALNSQINRYSKFDRKNYFYPDLPKGYQISQYDLPLAAGGFLTISPNRDIAITRLHLEEDTGKLSHQEDSSLVDFNRAGLPLIEMVTEPVIASAEEAKLFCKRFQSILRYLDISAADMDKGLMRCEANISLQRPGSWVYQDGQILPVGEELLNHKVEVKNINSFRAVEKAIDYEIKRQGESLDAGKKIKAETRGWNESKNATVAQRSKETQADYRYFPEPDLPPLQLDETYIEKVRGLIVELPHEKIARFQAEYGLEESDASLLADNRDLADYFEQVISELRAWIASEGDDWERQNRKLSKTAYNWLTTELLKLMNSSGIALEDVKITPENMAELIKLVYKNHINSSAGQTIMAALFARGGEPLQLMRELGLEQIDDQAALAAAVEQVLTDFPLQAAELKAGKTSLVNFFVGKTMAASAGKANPLIVEKILNDLIK